MTKMPAYDQAVLLEAMEFAFDAHLGQTDKSGLPYVFHPIGVARRAMMRGAPQHVVVAAFLHDTIEDCGVDPDEIERRFGADVRRLVVAVSRVEVGEIKEEYHSGLIARCCSMWDAALLKLCDTDDNLDEERMVNLTPQERAFLHKRYGKSRPRLMDAAGLLA